MNKNYTLLIKNETSLLSNLYYRWKEESKAVTHKFEQTVNELR